MNTIATTLLTILTAAIGLPGAAEATLAAEMQTTPPRTWTATGRVTDPAGVPIPNAGVRVATGYATLLGGGGGATGDDGRFEFEFGEGIFTSENRPNTQVAMYSVSCTGYVELSRSRPENTMMARFLPGQRDLDRFGLTPDDVAIAGKSFVIDFVMSRPVELAIDVVDERGELIQDAGLEVEGGNQDSRVSGGARGDAQFAWNLCPGIEWSLSVPAAGRFRSISSPIRFAAPGRYRATLRWVSVAQDGCDTLEWVSVRNVGDEKDADVLDDLVRPSPLAKRPLSPPLQMKTRELVARMAKANRTWLVDAPRDIKTLRYRLGEQEIHATNRAQLTSLRRPAHHSTLHLMAESPDALVYRDFTEAGGRITIAYTAREPLRVSAGNGVTGSYRGYFSTPVRDGILELDAKTLSPLRHTMHDIAVTYGDQVEVAPGQFAPLRIEVAGSSRMDWRFQIVEPGLWMIAEMRFADAEPLVAADIEVDGRPARVRHPAPR